MGVLRGIVVIVSMLVLVACTPAAPTASTTSRPPAVSSPQRDIAGDAEQVIRRNFGLAPDEPFASYECHSEGALCWVQYITGFTYRYGILRVSVQVDRGTVFGREVGANTAKAVRNFLVAEGGVVAHGDWVEAVDGTGTTIAQEQL